MKLNALALSLILTPFLLPACTEKEYSATAIVAVQSSMPGPAGRDAPVPEHEIRKQAALLTSLSTIRKTVEGKRFQHWSAYQGNTVEQVARQLLPRLRARILPRTNLIELSCSHPDPDLAHRIVNSIIDVVIEQQTDDARQALLGPMANWQQERSIIRSRIEDLGNEFLREHPGFSTPREMVLEFDRLRQSLLTYSGKLDELTLSLSAAEPLADAIRRALAEGGAGLSALYDHPGLTRRPEDRDLSVNSNTAAAELESLQEYLAPQHPQVQAAMTRVRDLEARLRNFRDTWLLGKLADYDALTTQRERVRELQSDVAGETHRLAVVMTAYDDAEKQKIADEQRLAIIDARIDEILSQWKVVRAGIALIEPAARPRSHD